LHDTTDDEANRKDQGMKPRPMFGGSALSH
jgi:hypothetical protein